MGTFMEKVRYCKLKCRRFQTNISRRPLVSELCTKEIWHKFMSKSQQMRLRSTHIVLYHYGSRAGYIVVTIIVLG